MKFFLKIICLAILTATNGFTASRLIELEFREVKAITSLSEQRAKSLYRKILHSPEEKGCLSQQKSYALFSLFQFFACAPFQYFSFFYPKALLQPGCCHQ